MKYFVFFTFLLTLFCQTVLSQSKASIQNPNTSLAYIENKGQWNNNVTCLARAKNIDNWILSDGGILLDFYKIIKSKSDNKPSFKLTESTKFDSINGHRIHLNWLKSNTNLVFYKTKKHTEYYNYLVGKDISKHASNVALYDELYAKNLYQGIDIRYYCANNSIRYDLIVKPNANTNQIKLQLDGVININKDEKGNIIMHTNIGEISMQDLFVYEKETNKQIECKWVIDENNELRLSIGQYNKSNTLIIDPLIYSTYLGGNNPEIGHDIIVNDLGEAYITGITQSANFDFTLGAYQTTNTGMYDAFISKLNSIGSSLIFSTFLGGSGDDHSWCIKFDNTGSLYVVGYTTSYDFPTTPGVFKTSHNMGLTTNFDVFVSKVNASGSSLIYSTYIGGTSDDFTKSFDLDNQNNIYIAGFTLSSDFDVTSGAYQTNFSSSGGEEAFVTKLNSSGSSLIYSTLIGGTGIDAANSIKVDSTKNAYIVGVTSSTDFDITSGVLQSVNGSGPSDIFVTKLNSTGSSLIYSTFIGGSLDDIGNAITIDSIGNSYITGFTNSINYPISSGAFQNIYATNGDCFVTKINTTGSSILFSTYIGGNSLEEGRDIILDSICNIYITGYSYSQYYYTTPSAIQSSIPFPSFFNADIIVTKFSNTGSVLYSTLLGGISSESSDGIDIDKFGDLYITGRTTSIDYPVTPGVFQSSLQGGASDDAYVTKIGFCHSAIFNIITNNITCNNNNDGTANINYTGNLTGVTFGWPPLSASSQSISGLSPGTYTAIITDVFGCSTSKDFIITEPPPIVSSITGSSIICSGYTATLTATGSNNYLWSTGATSDIIVINPVVTTNYSVIVSNGNCSDTAFAVLSVVPIPVATISGNDSICIGQKINLTAQGGTTYQWNTGETINTISINPTVNTTYSVVVGNGVCIDTAQKTIIVNSLPFFTISADTTILSDNTINLIASGGNTYFWLPIGLSCNTCPEITVSPNQTMIYTVTITGLNGCVTKEITIHVINELNVFIPDVFSPNGDGENDVLYVRGLGIKEILFKLYDRLGEKIFETNDVTKGWDGNYKGAVLNNAVFVYELIATMHDGSKINKHGDVTLIK